MNDGPVGFITRSEVVALLGRIPRLGIWLNHLSKEQGQCPWTEEPPHEAGQLGAAPPRPKPRPAPRPAVTCPGWGRGPRSAGPLPYLSFPFCPFPLQVRGRSRFFFQSKLTKPQCLIDLKMSVLPASGGKNLSKDPKLFPLSPQRQKADRSCALKPQRPFLLQNTQIQRPSLHPGKVCFNL